MSIFLSRLAEPESKFFKRTQKFCSSNLNLKQNLIDFPEFIEKSIQDILTDKFSKEISRGWRLTLWTFQFSMIIQGPQHALFQLRI